MVLELNELEIKEIKNLDEELKSLNILSNDSSDLGIIKLINYILNNPFKLDEKDIKKIITNNRNFYVLLSLSYSYLLLSLDKSSIDKCDLDLLDFNVIRCVMRRLAELIKSILLTQSNGLDSSSCIVCRSLIELTWIFNIITYDHQKMKLYKNKSISEYDKWNCYFKPSILKKDLEKIESDILKDDKDCAIYLKKVRNKIYKQYSKYTHTGFDALNLELDLNSMFSENIIKESKVLMNGCYLMSYTILLFEFTLVKIYNIKFPINQNTIIKSVIYSLIKTLTPKYIEDI